MKQTAVEFLLEKYKSQNTLLFGEDFEQAKEMEKQQIAELLAKLDSDIAKELTFKPKQERMYSEEEVIELLTARCKHFGTTMTPFRELLLKQDLEWFEENKKKIIWNKQQ